MSLIETLPHKIDIAHITYTQDASGADVENDPVIYIADEPAWIQPLSNREIDFYKSRNQDVSHKVYLTRNPGIALADVITAKDGDDVACPYAGRHLLFRGFAEATAGIGLLWKALCYINQEEL